jgi:hypothetical protein
MLRAQFASLLPLATAALAGCNFAPECFTVAVDMPATIERDGVSAPSGLSGQLYSFQFASFEHFETTRAFLTEGGVESSAGAVGWALAGTGATLRGGIRLRGPRQLGEVVPVSTGSKGASSGTDTSVWGPREMSRAAQAEATLQAEGIDASAGDGGTVTGTLRVLGVRPLSIDADLVARDLDGGELRLRGEMRFQVRRTACP